ncbi:MAG: DNA methyltransferase, partial [bacterium]
TKEKTMYNKIEGILANDYNDLINEEKNTLLLNHTSEDLSEIPDGSIDAVITDPPYYDNVMYSELSDFYYVWLREFLKDEYDNFQNELTPKFSEIIKNNVQEKDDEFYINGLTRVFKESRKKLKDNGIMVFTFHHQNNKAWSAVLKSVLDAGLYVTAIYPIQAEMSTSMHINNKANVEYDMIIVCRKRLSHLEEKSWNKLKDQLSYQINDIIKELEIKDNDLTMGDIFIIALGKCLEVYSQHYPMVMEKGKQVSVEKAINDVQEIIDSEISFERMQQLINDFDEESAIYLSFLLGKGKEISYSNLNKELSSRNIDINNLINSNIVKKDSNMLKILEPEERYEIIKDKEKILAIDQADYFYNLVKEGNLKAAQKAATEKAYKFLKKQNENGRGVKKYMKQAIDLAESIL